MYAPRRYSLGFIDPITISASIAAANQAFGLFGQADKRNAERMRQNEIAFTAASNGGKWDLEFLRGRSGKYGTVNIPVQLSYAKSPSSGDAETPGPIGGWATTPAKDHAAMLLDQLTALPQAPSSFPQIPGVDVPFPGTDFQLPAGTKSGLVTFGLLAAGLLLAPKLLGRRR